MTSRQPSLRVPTVVTTALALVAFAAPMAGADESPNPYTKLDGAWISLSGTVKNVTADAFTLEFEDGSVLVEMDDGDRDADGYKLIAGDKVTVHGRIDDDFFEHTKIEASSVYVEKLGTHFWASAIDEEDAYYYSPVFTPVVVATGAVQGKVTMVGDEEFVLDTGLRALTVEVEEMPYNPLHDEGYQKIEVGDIVRVTGEIDYDLFEGRELVADSVVELFQG